MSRSERFAEFLVCAAMTAWLGFFVIVFVVAFVMLVEGRSLTVIGP